MSDRVNRVIPTASESASLAVLGPLIADLAEDLPPGVRYQRLLEALQRLLPCDAVALLRLDGEMLTPLAIRGLSADTLGRRYRVDDHPRLRAILDAPGSLLFPPDCLLPDPYDGLVLADRETPGAGDGGARHDRLDGRFDGRFDRLDDRLDGRREGPRLAVHDCMGCALRVHDRLWGVLTLDDLAAGRFAPADQRLLETFASLAAATVAASMRLDALTRDVADERRRAEGYRLALAPGHERFIGRSPAFETLIGEIDLVAPSDLTVLINGETGTGKELVARQLHARSRRADKPQISINCAALPEHLVESELFGHVRGAFSGAIGDRPGKFEAAHGGTLFLDEIGELPLAVQAKLLRVLQDGQLQRVGSDREHRVDVRLIAATNRELADEVRSRRFRADLYHRISTYPMRVPPLRERGRDVVLLAGAFLEENRRRLGLRGLRLSARGQAGLLAHRWPGNVRELEYLIARATLKARGRLPARDRSGIVTLDLDDLGLGLTAATTLDAPSPARAGAPATLLPASLLGTSGPLGTGSTPSEPRIDLRSAVDAYQRRLIELSLEACDGNIAASARQLGLDRANLVRLARRLAVPITRPACRRRATPC